LLLMLLLLLLLYNYCLGIILIVFGLWITLGLTTEQAANINVHWIAILSFTLGGLIVSISSLSYLSMYYVDFRRTIIPISYLSLLVTGLAFGAVIAQLVCRAGFHHYMDNDQDNSLPPGQAPEEISTKVGNTLKTLYTITSFLNFVEVCTSLIRFGGGGSYYRSLLKVEHSRSRSNSSSGGNSGSKQSNSGRHRSSSSLL
jgi:hypothetical protein